MQAWLDMNRVARRVNRRAHCRWRARRVWLAATALVVAMSVATRAAPVMGEAPNANSAPVPLLAYYYIWFDPSSWDRAKTDYPILGRYSSDDEQVMRQHVQWAKAAGIQGFIVSWKSTAKLNARLEKLATVAESEDFKLLVIYQGLDFYRDPLPISRIDSDLEYFIRAFGSRPAFDLFGKPVVLWSGIWEFSREDVASQSTKYRNDIQLLATEKSIKGYERIADLVDGNAYYWSSVNPETNANHESKLQAMAQAVHKHHGLWIAPAAPGFDARLVGGTSVVDRKNGDTLRAQLNVALNVTPDAIGIISWNEFSENTFIEPSEKLGDTYLKVLADLQSAPAPSIPDFDSSDPGDTAPTLDPGRIVGLGGLIAMTAASFLVIWRRQAAR